MSSYTGQKLKDFISIDTLYTVHYFEHLCNYLLGGEEHDFWKMVYVDKGEVIAGTKDRDIILSQGSIVFYKPNEWHSIRSNSACEPNLVVLSFGSSSKSMHFFEGKTFTINQHQKRLISKILTEYSNCFSTPFNLPESKSLTQNEHSSVGAQQLLRQYICEFLISIMRSDTPNKGQASMLKHTGANTLLNRLLNYMESNINRSISLIELIKYSGSNKTTITNIFKEAFGMSAIEYFIHMKIEQAKIYFREGTYNATEISDMLGYSSIHYFSRQFKKVTGMSPTEYSLSVKAMLS